MELRDYLNVIRSRKGVIILATLVVTSISVAMSLLRSPMYQSEAKVLISETDAGSALLGTLLPELSSQPERALQTQVQLVELRPIAEAAVKELGIQATPDSILGAVEVSTIGQTNIISIKATSPDPEMAADIANVMAEQYVLASRDRKRASVKETADEVEQRLEQAETEILEIGRKLRDRDEVDEELQAQLEIATGLYANLAEQLEQMRIKEQLEGGSGAIVQSAVSNTSPVSPQPTRNGILGFAIGLGFGVAMAFLYEYLDSTIKSTEEAERVYGGPVLGTIPAEKIEKGVKRRLAIERSPGSTTAEAYRVLRNSLDFINFEHDLKTLLVTSAAPSEGKSTVAANLSAALAQAGKRVVLCSVDFRRPTTDQFFTVNNQIGLSDVLIGTCSLKSALQQPGSDQLLILTSGKMPPNPSELLGSRKMRDVIESLKEWADWVIVDAPPLLAVADPAAVARWVDGVLMVSKAGESTRENGRKATELLDKVGARVAGVAIWGLDESKAGGGYGYYAGGYYYYHSYYATPMAEQGTGADDVWGMAKDTGGRKAAKVLGRIVTAALSFAAVLAVLMLAVYFLDEYFGWGVAEAVRQMLL